LLSIQDATLTRFLGRNKKIVFMSDSSIIEYMKISLCVALLLQFQQEIIV